MRVLNSPLMTPLFLGSIVGAVGAITYLGVALKSGSTFFLIDLESYKNEILSGVQLIVQ